jgi:predicted nucleic acid-binding protein
VHRVGVGGRVNRDRADAHFMASAVDPERDLAAIGDQQLIDVRHQRLSR